MPNNFNLRHTDGTWKLSSNFHTIFRSMLWTSRGMHSRRLFVWLLLPFHIRIKNVCVCVRIHYDYLMYICPSAIIFYPPNPLSALQQEKKEGKIVLRKSLSSHSYYSVSKWALMILPLFFSHFGLQANPECM